MVRTDIVHKHALNTVLQGDGARVASSASTAELQKDLAIHETSEFNVATIFLNSRANTSLEQLFNHADNLAVVLVVFQRVLLSWLLFAILSCHSVHQRLTRCDGLGNQAEDLRLDVGPRCGGILCDGDVVRAVKD